LRSTHRPATSVSASGRAFRGDPAPAPSPLIIAPPLPLWPPTPAPTREAAATSRWQRPPPPAAPVALTPPWPPAQQWWPPATRVADAAVTGTPRQRAESECFSSLLLAAPPMVPKANKVCCRHRWSGGGGGTATGTVAPRAARQAKGESLVPDARSTSWGRPAQGALMTWLQLHLQGGETSGRTASRTAAVPAVALRPHLAGSIRLLWGSQISLFDPNRSFSTPPVPTY